MKNCRNCGTELRDEDRICYRCGTEYVEEESVAEGENGTPEATDPKAYKLKWHKVFIALLLISGIIRIIYSVQMITGWNLYIIDKVNATEFAYLLYPGLKVLNIAFGAIDLATAVLSYFVSFWLIKYRKKALKWLGILILVWAVSRVLYSVGASIIFKKNFFEGQSFINTMLGYLIGGVINWVYYSRRKELFGLRELADNENMI